jgi:hypothetical protein
VTAQSSSMVTLSRLGSTRGDARYAGLAIAELGNESVTPGQAFGAHARSECHDCLRVGELVPELEDELAEILVLVVGENTSGMASLNQWSEGDLQSVSANAVAEQHLDRLEPCG